MSARTPRVIVPTMTFRRLFALLVPLASVGTVAACGSRTGLIIPTEEPLEDAGRETGMDASADAREEDAGEEDALPAIDVTQPPPDAPNPCPDAGDTLIYVITEQNILLSFDPPTGMFEHIGTIACPVTGTCTAPGQPPAPANPFSMAVDSQGIAYVVYCDGELFRVSTATASCEPTGFLVGQGGFPQTFGMGFSRDPNGTTETLYVAGDPGQTETVPAVLGSIDTTFALTNIGPFAPSIYGPELTGTGAGDLFAFYAIGQENESQTAPTAIGQIDKTNGRVIAQTPLPGVFLQDGWAFGFWGGDFYLFTAPGGSSIVTRYRPSDGSIVQVASTPGEIVVGAGVSTCAPAR